MTQMAGTGPQRTYVVVTPDQPSTGPGPSAGDLAGRVRRLFAEGVRTVLVDLSDVQRLSSDIVAALLQARREARSHGGRVVLHAPNRRSASLVSRSELGGLFEVDVAAVRPSPWRHA